MCLKTYDDKKNGDIIVSFSCLFGGVLIISAMPFYGYVLAGCGAYLLARRILKMDRYTVLFKQLGLHAEDMYPELKEVRRTDYSVIRRYSLPPGLGLQDFVKNRDRIEDFIGKRVDIKCHAKNIIIEIFEKGMEHFDFEPREYTGIKFSLGKQRNGQPLILDMAKSPHLLIAGETGSGKSTLLRSILTALCLKPCSLYLIDLKGGVEFSVFAKSSKVEGFGRTKSEAPDTVKAAQDEVNRRYDLFYDADVPDINEYNKTENLRYAILVIDEFAELMNVKECKEMLYDILARGRAAGVLCIISTQRPDAKVLDGLLKANIVNTVGLRTHNRVNSDIVIGDGGLERLNGNGHGLFVSGGKTIEFQAPYISVDGVRELIKHTYIKKEKSKVLYGGFQ